MMIKFLSVSILLLLALPTQAQDHDHDYWVLKRRTPGWALVEFNSFNTDTLYNISDFVNPFYFEEDFNGDENLDIALLVENKITQQKGILIIHGKSAFRQVIGAGTMFGKRTDDYFWMDVWKIFRGSEIEELVVSTEGDIEGSRLVQIKYPSLEIIKTEASSRVIYWDGAKYCRALTSD